MKTKQYIGTFYSEDELISKSGRRLLRDRQGKVEYRTRP